MSGTARLLLMMAAVLVLAISACGASGDDRPASGAGSGDSSDSDNNNSDNDVARSTGAVVANSPGTITTAGPQRIMTAILGPDTRPFLGGSDQPISITFQPAGGGPAVEAEATWLSTNGTGFGLYVSTVEFPTTGTWDVTASADGSEVARTSIQVSDESPVPRIGDQAPATDSLTGTSDEEIDAISTDPEPDPAFYDLSIADAVANGRPTVIAFVTPGLCQTALCGPTLDAVKAAADGRDGLDVVHVEPFDLELATAGELRPIPAMADWGLQTEPWVFIVDGEGTVRASLEGVIGREELEAALDQLGDSP